MYWLQEIRGERQLVAELALTVEDDGMIVTNISQSRPSCLHVLTIPGDNRSDCDTTIMIVLPSVQLADI